MLLSKRHPLRLVVIAFFLPVFLVTLMITLASAFTLIRGGEVRHLEALVRDLGSGDHLYNSPARDNRAFKLALIDTRDPEVVVVGSSRAMLFRGDMFAGDFANAGGTVGDLKGLLGFLGALESRTNIKLVLLQLDYWWFDNDVPSRDLDGPDYRPGRANYPWGVNLMAPAFVWLEGNPLAGLVSFSRGALARLPMDAETIVSSVGLSARTNGTGYAADGSYYYGASLYCKYRTPSLRRPITQRNARNRMDEFAPRRVWPASIVALEHAIEKLEARGISVVPFTMPLAPALYDLIAENETFGEISRSLSAAFSDFVDLHNPSLFPGLDDSGFIDAVHPGEVVYRQALLKLRERLPELEMRIASNGTNQLRADINQVIPESGAIGGAFQAADEREDHHLSAICGDGS